MTAPPPAGCVPGAPNAACRCKVAEHRHGSYVTFVADGCKGDACRKANNEYERRRSRDRGYGRAAFVPTAPAVDHMRALMAAGMGAKRIAQLAGLAYSTVGAVMYGRCDRGDGTPRTQARATTVAAILAVPMPAPDRPRLLAPGALADGTGTRRRLRALVRVGWAQAQLADRLNMTPAHLTRLLGDDGFRIRAATALQVRDLYERIWDTAPRADDHRSRISVSRARRYAAARGWEPPMAWDDDTIDLPEGAPAAEGIVDADDLDDVAIDRALAGNGRTALTRQEHREAVRRGHSLGLSDSAVAARLGVTKDAVLKTRIRMAS